MKKSFYLLASSFLLTLSFFYSIDGVAQNKRPNILVIMGDDISRNSMGVYGSKYANFDGVLKQYGWNGNSFTKHICSLGDKTPEVAVKMFQARLQHILRISSSGKNTKFRNGWLNRLIKNKDSNLMMLVKFNELFNLNSKGHFQLTAKELEHLKRKGEIYKTLNIDIPT